METYNRICIEDFALEAKNGDKLELKRGKEYLTGKRKNNMVTVFTNYWVPVDVSLFAGEVRFS